MLLDRVQMNVVEMLVIILGIANPVIRESATPDFCIRSDFALCSK